MIVNLVLWVAVVVNVGNMVLAVRMRRRWRHDRQREADVMEAAASVMRSMADDGHAPPQALRVLAAGLVYQAYVARIQAAANRRELNAIVGKLDGAVEGNP